LRAEPAAEAGLETADWADELALGILSMRYSTQIKSISYLKANAAEVLQELTEQRKPLQPTAHR
jgi:hypothetical protein